MAAARITRGQAAGKPPALPHSTRTAGHALAPLATHTHLSHRYGAALPLGHPLRPHGTAEDPLSSHTVLCRQFVGPVAWWGFRVPLAMLNTCGTHCAPGASVPSSMVAAAVLDGGVVTHAAPHPGGPQNRAALGGQHPLAVGCMLGPPNITIQRDRVSNSTTARASIVWARLAAALPPPVS